MLSQSEVDDIRQEWERGWVKEDIIDLCDTVSELRKEIEHLREIIKPFAHEDLCEVLSGNVEGDARIVWVRNKAKLTIGDFRAANEEFNKGLEF